MATMPYYPETIRTSTAAALTLGLKRGRFYRNARLGCINVLLTYPDGCRANCAYCGLARQRSGRDASKSFIRVDWPVVRTDVLIDAMNGKIDRLRRICISMITHDRAADDTLALTRILKESVNLPISLLITPTQVDRHMLALFHEAGADRIGIAVDAATPEIFDRYRGGMVHGPHRWDRYWECFDDAVTEFGRGFVGSHLIVGLGETEKDMVSAFWKTCQAGGVTHLFSFYPEPGSFLHHQPPPPLASYRRMQLARYLIDTGVVTNTDCVFDSSGTLRAFSKPGLNLDRLIESGRPFETSGCPGNDGEVACNRPFANSEPGPDVRNLPYRATNDDIDRIRMSLGADFLTNRHSVR
ncbi:radical SAM protein [bacterium]|nr:radical SAM protein [candidate division CSSED10-310 bacterium]